jgi:hypothetical protein
VVPPVEGPCKLVSELNRSSICKGFFIGGIMGERRAHQGEMSYRNSDRLPFIDDLAVKQAVSVISRGLEVSGKDEGEVIFPFTLTRAEQEKIRRHKSGIGARVGYMIEVPLQEGVGTMIQIKEKQARQRRR